MRILLLFIFSIFHSTASYTQVKCIEDVDGNCIAKGKMKVFTQKSSFGGKYDIAVRIDKWEFFSTDGIKVSEGIYKEKEKASFKDGIWSYYSDDQRLLFKRWYDLGNISKTVFYDTGCYTYVDEQVCIVSASDSIDTLTVTEKKGTLSFHYKIQVKAELAGDPYKFSILAAKQAMVNKQVKIPKQVSIPDPAPVYRKENDASILLKYPNIRFTLDIEPWPVKSPLNLAGNGDLELNRSKMKDGLRSELFRYNDPFAKFWGTANETPDLFRIDTNCFAGFRIIGVNFEVVRNQLRKPLEGGKTYCLQFKLKLKAENTHAANGISVLCTKELKTFGKSEEDDPDDIVLQTHADIVLGCREEWMVISGSFTANGGEKYLYFGNFTPKDLFKMSKLDSTASDNIFEIYYYIDDVMMMEETSSYECPCNASGCELNENEKVTVDTIPLPEEDIFLHPKIGQKLILTNIQFETGKWTLLDESFETLDSLVDLMLKFPDMRVEISGHTDNKGNKKDNHTLSENRAKAVVQFLVDNGIEENRLEYKGYGQTQPIDTNETEEGRYNNRRVEFVILEL